MVHRGMSPDDPLASGLSRNAVTAGADTRIRFADQGYEASFNVGVTHIDGEPDAIAGFQQRNSHLFQRVDLPVPLLDVSRRALDGGQVTGRINKLSGRHWIWNASAMIESPESVQRAMIKVGNRSVIADSVSAGAIQRTPLG